MQYGMEKSNDLRLFRNINSLGLRRVRAAEQIASVRPTNRRGEDGRERTEALKRKDKVLIAAGIQNKSSPSTD